MHRENMENIPNLLLYLMYDSISFHRHTESLPQI